jgi:hypothetical protein
VVAASTQGGIGFNPLFIYTRLNPRYLRKGSNFE